VLTDQQIVDQALAHMNRLIAEGRSDDDVSQLVAVELKDLHLARAVA
jgi:hypothetical protein